MMVRQICRKSPTTLVNSVNPFRIETQKTGAFEICGQPGGASDLHMLPAGYAGNITAYWKGYKEHHERGEIHGMCLLTGHGLKAPDFAIKSIPKFIDIPARMDALLEAMGM